MDSARRWTIGAGPAGMRGAPVFISTVMVCPSLSCSSLSGIPMFLGEHSQPGQRSAARRRRRDSTEREQHRAAEQRLKCGAAFRTPPHTHSPTCGGRAARQRTWACACPPGFGCAGAGRRGGSGQRRAKAHAGSFGSAEEGEFLGAEWRGECWRAHPLIAPLPVAILGTPSVHGGGALRLEKCTFEAQAPLPGASFRRAQPLSCRLL